MCHIEKCILKPCLKAVLLFTILLVTADTDGFEICTQMNLKCPLLSLLKEEHCKTYEMQKQKWFEQLENEFGLCRQIIKIIPIILLL